MSQWETCLSVLSFRPRACVRGQSDGGSGSSARQSGQHQQHVAGRSQSARPVHHHVQTGRHRPGKRPFCFSPSLFSSQFLFWMSFAFVPFAGRARGRARSGPAEQSGPSAAENGPERLSQTQNGPVPSERPPRDRRLRHVPLPPHAGAASLRHTQVFCYFSVFNLN